MFIIQELPLLKLQTFTAQLPSSLEFVGIQIKLGVPTLLAKIATPDLGVLKHFRIIVTRSDVECLHKGKYLGSFFTQTGGGGRQPGAPIEPMMHHVLVDDNPVIIELDA